MIVACQSSLVIALTNRSANVFIIGRNGRTKLVEGLMSGMAKATVSQGDGGCSDQGVSWREVQRVQGPGVIAPDDQSLGQEILHRTASRVKFNRTIVIGSKLAY